MLRWLLDKVILVDDPARGVAKDNPRFRRRRRKIIVVVPRWADIWAGSVDTGEWGAGKSVQEALGYLVLHHQEEFGIDIKMMFGDKPARPLGVSYVTIPEDQYDAMMHATRWNRQ